MDFVFSITGNKLIKYCRFKYYKFRETAKGWKWRCTVKSCKSKLYLPKDESILLKCDLSHNHESSKFLHRQEMSNSVKRKVADASSDGP